MVALIEARAKATPMLSSPRGFAVPVLAENRSLQSRWRPNLYGLWGAKAPALKKGKGKSEKSTSGLYIAGEAGGDNEVLVFD